ncbi:class I SAM-dependent methyltransferase [Fuscibacter oryzae]|uniref:Methyltransferase domain-containing protein n=1 Tax=Fuscibacter oryzae TaxID=2803939 RepID=A0A8J7SWS8_9RHOB|nr:class I SAM-dependent methyltransferase [Fuscibacter oryzae]MBL4929986.1 methyltransferase domain-containing protein [Fuscibacter oryzae]
MPTPSQMFDDGTAYERMMGRWSQQVGEPFLDWLALPSGLRWLDVGCGNGAFTEVVRRHDPTATLTGIDPAPGQIAYAHQRAGTEGITFLTGDAQDLPFADGSFDVSVMALVIAFVPDPVQALHEMTRATRPGGMVATYMWDLPHGVPLAPLHRALAELGHPAPQPPSAGRVGPAGLADLWQSAGLVEIAAKQITIPVTFEDLDDFWQSNVQFIGPLGEVLRHLPQGGRDALRARLGMILPIDAQGRITYRAVANAIRGRRPATGRP